MNDATWLDELEGEFNPPNCATNLVSVLRSVILRCRGLQDFQARHVFLKQVPCALVR
jgi:hypothetical protein